MAGWAGGRPDSAQPLFEEDVFPYEVVLPLYAGDVAFDIHDHPRHVTLAIDDHGVPFREGGGLRRERER